MENHGNSVEARSQKPLLKEKSSPIPLSPIVRSDSHPPSFCAGVVVGTAGTVGCENNRSLTFLWVQGQPSHVSTIRQPWPSSPRSCVPSCEGIGAAGVRWASGSGSGGGEEQYEGLAYWQVVRVTGVRVGLPSAAMTIVPGRSRSSVVGRDGRSGGASEMSQEDQALAPLLSGSPGPEPQQAGPAAAGALRRSSTGDGTTFPRAPRPFPSPTSTGRGFGCIRISRFNRSTSSQARAP